VVKKPTAKDLRAVREELGMSQAEFAAAFHLNKRSVENWEQDSKLPSGAGAVLFWLICNAPKTVLKLLKGAK
jgi:putative transcriptional regulator